MTFEAFLKKLIEDPAFRKSVEEDAEAAFREAGLELSGNLAADLRKVDWHALRNVAQHFEDPKVGTALC